MVSSRWFVIPKPNPNARVRLYCLPYGGGGASVFRDWPVGLQAEVEVCAVQLPARENRIREAPFTRMADLVDALLRELRGHLHARFALLGHSLGAFVAFEVARQLIATGLTPAHLFVCGQHAPDVPGLYPPIYKLADGAFVSAVIARYAGIPESVLQDPEMMRLVLPRLRGDFELNDTYTYAHGAPLACPITVYRGLDDPETPEAGCAAWQRHTSLELRTRTFPGGHLFINESRSQVLRALAEDLLPYAAC